MPPKTGIGYVSQAAGERSPLKLFGRYKMKRAEAVQRFPEVKQVLQQFHHGGTPRKPRKFYEELRVVPCPAEFNPSAQGDFAFTKAFSWDGERLTEGPSYSYDSMMASGVNPYMRKVDVPAGKRMWVLTYDGQWDGHWSRVDVYVHHVS